MLFFDHVRHEYWDGPRLIPSVTQILRPLTDFSHVSPEILAAAQSFGTAVHRACELDDLGQLDAATLDAALVPYLVGWRKFCRDHGARWSAVESRVYDKAMGFAGTLDRVGLVDGFNSIVDIKSGTTLFPATGPQTAAYAHAFDKVAGRAMRRYAVRLFPGGYELKAYTDPSDWSLFCSLLTLRQWCRKHHITPIF